MTILEKRPKEGYCRERDCEDIVVESNSRWAWLDPNKDAKIMFSLTCLLWELIIQAFMRDGNKNVEKIQYSVCTNNKLP